jgi:quercetin dioxygenase-like cupin family protein
MAYVPSTWRLSEFKSDDAPTPDAIDPQTDGKLWQIWNVARNDVIDVLYARVFSGNRTGAHTHPDANHYTCIIEGTAIVWMEGTMLTLECGDVVNIPVGVLHDFGADTTGDCWVVDLTSPPFDPEKMQFQPEREEEIAAAFAAAMSGPA